jgi:hypothetical protein
MTFSSPDHVLDAEQIKVFAAQLDIAPSRSKPARAIVLMESLTLNQAGA